MEVSNDRGITILKQMINHNEFDCAHAMSNSTVKIKSNIILIIIMYNMNIIFNVHIGN